MRERNHETDLGRPRLLLDRFADVLALRLLSAGGSSPPDEHGEGDKVEATKDIRDRTETSCGDVTGRAIESPKRQQEKQASSKASETGDTKGRKSRGGR